MIEFPCEQGSPQWLEMHRGVPTASNFDKIMTTKARKLSSSILPFCYKLIGQLYYPGPLSEADVYESDDMRRGRELEDQARRAYSLVKDVAVRQVGFVMDDASQFGCSPDGLVGNDGGLEIKCPRLSKHAEYLHAGVLPDDYACQVHGSLIVTGRQWWDFMSYAHGLPPLIVRVVPGDFTLALRKALHQFWAQYAAIKAEMQAFKMLDEPAVEKGGPS